MICPNCNAEVNELKFCENCGAALPAPASEQPAQEAQQTAQQVARSVIEPLPAAQPQAQPQPQIQPQPQQPQLAYGAAPIGSNAPFVLAIIALVCALLFLFPISLILAIIALVMNSRQKKRGEASTKRGATTALGVISIVFSILELLFAIAIAGAVWLAYESGDIDRYLEVNVATSLVEHV